jgi:hypothetical protein
MLDPKKQIEREFASGRLSQDAKEWTPAFSQESRTTLFNHVHEFGSIPSRLIVL